MLSFIQCSKQNKRQTNYRWDHLAGQYIIEGNVLICMYLSAKSLVGITMKAILLLLLLTVFAELQKEVNASQALCPAWTEPKNGQCECYDRMDDIVKCKEGTPETTEVQLMACYCMTTSEILNLTVGSCLYSCDRHYYQDITTSVENINNATCGRLHRTGQLCGKCWDNYSPPVYSYTSCCTACNDHKKVHNWFKYIAIAFLPLTVFYCSVIAFRLSATSAVMNGYVLVSQIASTPAQLRYIYSLHDDKSSDRCIKGYTDHSDLTRRTVMSLYAIWNLDFFRSLYPPFCTQSNIHPLTVIALDYIIAIYPLCLVLITYTWVVLHDRFLVINRISVPLLNVFARFRSHWNIRTTLIDAFATFILLSYVKILNVSIDLLTPTVLHDISGKKSKRMFLYYDGTVEMFHGIHIPFALLAVLMTMVFNIIPLLIMCLYPCRWFHKLLNSCRANSATLHIFMDSFQGCYKIKPRDCRYFAGFYLGVRIVNLFIFNLTLSRFYYPFASLLMMCTAAVVAIVRPYKSSKINTLDTILLLSVALAYLSVAGYALTPGKLYNRQFVWIVCLMVPVPLTYGIGLAAYKLILRRIYKRLKESLTRTQSTQTEFEEIHEERGSTANESTPLLTP